MRTLSLGLAIAALTFAGPAAAQPSRSQSITLVVTWGGPADTLAGWWPLIKAANIKAE